jgi:hypothetical protein
MVASHERSLLRISEYDVVLRNPQSYSTGSRAAHTDTVKALLFLETAWERPGRLGK